MLLCALCFFVFACLLFCLIALCLFAFCLFAFLLFAHLPFCIVWPLIFAAAPRLVGFTICCFEIRFAVHLTRQKTSAGKKPSNCCCANCASSLRGIRLLSYFTSWFGWVLDRSARAIWQAGHEQFGFKEGVRRMDALTVILALAFPERARKRLFVLWVDLRTALPFLNRLYRCGSCFVAGGVWVHAAFCLQLLMLPSVQYW